MDNEVLKKYIGKNCKISTGSYGSTVSGRMLDIKDNWIEVETRKGIEIINAEFVQTLKISQ